MHILSVSEGHWHSYGRRCARLAAATACRGPKLKLALGMVHDVLNILPCDHRTQFLIKALREAKPDVPVAPEIDAEAAAAEAAKAAEAAEAEDEARIKRIQQKRQDSAGPQSAHYLFFFEEANLFHMS